MAVWCGRKRVARQLTPDGGERVVARRGLPSARRAARQRWLRPLPPSPTTGQKCLRWKCQAVPGRGVGDLWQVVAPLAGSRRWHAVVKLGNRSACPPASRQRAELAAHEDSRLELFADTADADVWHRVLRTATDPSSWSPWAACRNGTTARGHEARCGGGRYRRASADRQRGYKVWHTAQTAADADTWTQWSKLAAVPGSSDATDGEKLGAPAVGFNQAGLVEIFVVDGTGGELYRLQATASGQLTLGPQTFAQP